MFVVRELRCGLAFGCHLQLQAIFFNIGLGFDGFSGQQVAQEDDPDDQRQEHAANAQHDPMVP